MVGSGVRALVQASVGFTSRCVCWYTGDLPVPLLAPELVECAAGVVGNLFIGTRRFRYALRALMLNAWVRVGQELLRHWRAVRPRVRIRALHALAVLTTAEPRVHAAGRDLSCML